MKYFIIAGEASGDLHASNLMKELKSLDSQAVFRYVGGDLMASVADGLFIHYRDMAYMGFTAVVAHAGTILNNLFLCRREVMAWQPDVLILVDYADFNLNMASYAKHHGLKAPVHYYISPKVWAWKTYRIKSFNKYLDRLYSILPFEKSFFETHGFNRALYVGNPSLDSVEDYKRSSSMDPDLFRRRHGLDERPILALLPGSRRAEVSSNLPLMMQVALSYPDFQVVVAGAPGLDAAFYQRIVPSFVPLIIGETYPLLDASYTALVTSGTATLETALFNVPQVVCYDVSVGYLANWFFDQFMHVPYNSLVNLIAEKEVVPELMGGLFTRSRLRQTLSALLYDQAERQLMEEGYAEVRRRLGEPGAARRTAEAIYKSLPVD
jgi:lipid-A-disaccharide synthase